MEKEKVKLMDERLRVKTQLLKEIEAERKDLWADYHKGHNGEEAKEDESGEDKAKK